MRVVHMLCSMFGRYLNLFSHWNTFHRTLNRQSQCFLESLASTIFALSTNIKHSGSAIAVVRVSGPETLPVIDRITKGKGDFYRNNPRKAVVQNYFDPVTNELVDHGMMIWFPKPKSYTGDDMCEMHIHGSHAVISRLLGIIGQMSRCRPAVEGEFTKRALLNGKLQLVQAEGIRDLIHARTEAQRRRALSVVSGLLDSTFQRWRSSIITALAHLEAYIDFSEDELIDQDIILQIKSTIKVLAEQIDTHLVRSKTKSQLIKDGFRVAIIGQANVGKSSLINKICERDISIISPISGTTRDVVETWIDMNGNVVCIADTAGIKDLHNDQSIDLVERQGIDKAIQRTKECHLIILVLDSSYILKHNEIVPSYLQAILACVDRDNLLITVNKIDLLSEDELYKIQDKLSKQAFTNISYMSCLNGEGFADFLELLRDKIETSCCDSPGETIFSNDRHIVHLEEAHKLLEKALQSLDLDLAICSLHLRQSSYHLGCLSGNVTTEDILDTIFKDFCIGK